MNDVRLPDGQQRFPPPQCGGNLAHDRVLPIYAVTPFTMLDYPGKTACIIWFSGCNMRCGYCHNPNIVKGKGTRTAQDVVQFLKRRIGLLDGVVLSGGEATLYPGLFDLAREIKTLGYSIKLDTNGTRPDIIRTLLDQQLIDYVALDFKAPQTKFKTITHRSDFTAVTRTLSLLIAQSVCAYEVRTTIHTSLLNEEDVNAIISELDILGYKGTLFLQNFRADNDRPTLGLLKDQERILDRQRLASPCGFTLAFRNFP